MNLPINRWQIQNVSGDNRMTSISGLTPNAVYTVCVLAYSSIGQGPMSDPKKIAVKPEGVLIFFAHLDIRFRDH